MASANVCVCHPATNNRTGAVRAARLATLAIVAATAWTIAAGVPSRFVEPSGCLWAREVYAWHDRNGDGIWNADEPPLADVRFSLIERATDELADPRIVASAADGWALVHVWLPTCGRAAFDIQARPPPGYDSTTPERIAARGDGPFDFGFSAKP